MRALNRLLAERLAVTRNDSVGSLGRGGSTSTLDAAEHDYEGWIFKRGQKVRDMELRAGFWMCCSRAVVILRATRIRQLHTWRRRYAVLDDNVLRYYTQQTHARDKTPARGRIGIRSVVAVDGPKVRALHSCKTFRLSAASLNGE
jgi:hypothetical protein